MELKLKRVWIAWRGIEGHIIKYLKERNWKRHYKFPEDAKSIYDILFCNNILVHLHPF